MKKIYCGKCDSVIDYDKYHECEGIITDCTQKQIDEMIKETWNAAIEAALKLCKERDTFEATLMYSRIRGLKK